MYHLISASILYIVVIVFVVSTGGVVGDVGLHDVYANVVLSYRYL